MMAGVSDDEDKGREVPVGGEVEDDRGESAAAGGEGGEEELDAACGATGDANDTLPRPPPDRASTLFR